MRVFLTGATGFIGSHLADRLHREGHPLVTLVRPTSDASRLEFAGARIIRGDVRDADDVRRAMDGCATVYHLAAARTFHTDDPADFVTINEIGTRNVMQSAAEQGVARVVHTSTVGVHGSRLEQVDEESPFRPDSAYRRTRLAAEEIVREHVEQGLSATIVRLTSVYGPRGVDWVSLFSEIVNGRLNLPGSGRNTFHISYVDDVVEALVRCGTRSGVERETYVVGSQSPGTLWSFVSAVADAADVHIRRRPWLDRPLAIASSIARPARSIDALHAVTRQLDFFVCSQRCDLSKAKRELALPPSVPVDVGVRRTIDWFRRYALI